MYEPIGFDLLPIDFDKSCFKDKLKARTNLKKKEKIAPAVPFAWESLKMVGTDLDQLQLSRSNIIYNYIVLHPNIIANCRWKGVG